MTRTCLALLMGLFSFLFGSPASAEPPATKPKPEDVGRALRQMMLTMPPAEIGLKPTPEFPHVYGVLMDLPMGHGQTATVLANATGTASLYTTSKFGIIGGEGHAQVRAAAVTFTRAAGEIFDTATPSKEFPYTPADHVRFYLLTFEGVRSIDVELSSIENGTSKYTHLFGLGQNVLTELRLISEKKQ
ncbi:MAG: hypothetical protein NTY98_00670 [Verrucomicrobia bacterium]|nr:hypothetical protein [Verrucomicrobiota bacterium]